MNGIHCNGSDMIVGSRDTNFDKISHLSKDTENERLFSNLCGFSEYLNFDEY